MAATTATPTWRASTGMGRAGPPRLEKARKIGAFAAPGWAAPPSRLRLPVPVAIAVALGEPVGRTFPMCGAGPESSGRPLPPPSAARRQRRSSREEYRRRGPSPRARESSSSGFSHFVTSMTAPVASGWSGCRVGLAPTGKRRLVTAHTLSGRCRSRSQTVRVGRSCGRCVEGEDECVRSLPLRRKGSDHVPRSGVAEGTDDDDFRQRRIRQMAIVGNPTTASSLRGDGFQGHVTGVLRANQLSLNSRGRIQVS
jgi:hypothetical protein